MPSSTKAIGGCEATRRSLKNGHPEYHLFVSGEHAILSAMPEFYRARAVAGRRQSVFSGRDDLFNDASKPT